MKTENCARSHSGHIFVNLLTWFRGPHFTRSPSLRKKSSTTGVHLCHTRALQAYACADMLRRLTSSCEQQKAYTCIAGCWPFFPNHFSTHDDEPKEASPSSTYHTLPTTGNTATLTGHSCRQCARNTGHFRLRLAHLVRYCSLVDFKLGYCSLVDFKLGHDAAGEINASPCRPVWHSTSWLFTSDVTFSHHTSPEKATTRYHFCFPESVASGSCSLYSDLRPDFLA